VSVTETAETTVAGRSNGSGAPGNGADGYGRGADGRAGRAEFGAFLRSRRERIGPEDVGLAPGGRRRTPGLRREEVAQLAGVGVTWYTWLEQGRPINASVQVLDAIARTLRLDGAEQAHMYRLAGVPGMMDPDEADGSGESAGSDGSDGSDVFGGFGRASHLPAEVRTILDGLDPLPGAVYNSRYDLLTWNRTYAALFPRLVSAPGCERNALWHMFVSPLCCNQFLNRDTELPRMVATLRGYFGRHVGEPAWTEFVRRLSAASPEFAQMWAAHEVAGPGRHVKIFRHASVGTIQLASTSLNLATPPETRLLVYTAMDAETETALSWLLAHPDAPAADHTH
jgi:transcriptional regulator with XRE-family HTH domain